METESVKVSNPYVGPRPFEQQHQDLFFGRDHEISELLSLITAHRVLLIYAQSGAGKTSLVNAGLIPRLEAEGFEILPTARVQGAIPTGIQLAELANPYIFNVLMSWIDPQSDRQALKEMSLAGFLSTRQHRLDETGLPSPRVIIFDQFEELLTFYPERWPDRTDFFTQIAEALVGSSLPLCESDLCDISTLVTKLCDYHNPLSEYLRGQFSPDVQQLLYAHDGSTPISEKLRKGLVDELNRLIQSEKIYAAERVERISLAEATQKLAAQNPQGRERLRLNRLLLEDTYPNEIKKQVAGDPLLRVVFVIREDHLAELDPYAAFLPGGFQTRFRLERLRGVAALLAVTGPLNNTDRTFAPQVAEALVAKLQQARTVTVTGEAAESEGQYVEPVQLQVVCRRLWAGLTPDIKVIEQRHVQEFGDVSQALATFYEEAIQATIQRTNIAEETLRRWFQATLITPMGTRSTVYRDEKRGTTGDISNTAINVLEDQHIIRAENRAGIRWYELTHDSLIKPILDSNNEWFESWRQTHRNPLTDGARDWLRLNKDEGSLFGGTQLDEAIAWAKQHAKELNELEQEFLDAGVVLRQRIAQEQAKNARILRWLVAGLVVALLIAGWAGGRAYFQRNAALDAQATAVMAQATAEAGRKEANVASARSEEDKIQAVFAQATAVASQRDALAQRDIATSRRLAAQAMASLQSDPQLTLLLGVEALTVTHTVEADSALRQALLESHTWAVLRSHTDKVNTVTFSHNGRLAATASEDGTAQVWNAETGELLTALAHPGGVLVAVFSPTNDKLTTVSRDGTVHRWTVSTGKELPSLDLSGAVDAVAFSDDGRLLASGGSDGTTQVWDIELRGRLAVLPSTAAGIKAIAFSRDGAKVATASLDGTARLWDVATGKEIAILVEHSSGVNTLVFSPDNHLLATGDADGTAHLWDAATGHERAVLRGHDSSVTTVVFSPNGQKLATGSVDRTARLWDVATGEALFTLSGHSDVINAVNFSPDGLLFATASADGSARLWNAVTGELQTTLQGHSASVGVVGFSRDGDLLATAGADATARIWTTGASEAQNVLRGHEAPIYGVAFNPQGNLLASSSDDGTVRLWDMTAMTQTASQYRSVTILHGDASFFSGVAFSPDGKLLAVGDRDGATHLWDVTKARNGDRDAQVAILLRHKGFVHGVAFIPDGNLLATGSEDGTARLWDIKRVTETGVKPTPETEGAGMEAVVLPVCAQTVYGVAFSADGSLLATSCADGTVRLWDVAAVRTTTPPQSLVILGAPSDNVIDVAFSRELLAAGSADGTVHLWDYQHVLATHDIEPIADLRGHSALVVGVTFNKEGNLLATSSTDGTSRLWDVQSVRRTGGSGTEITVQRGYEGGVYSVAFSPSGGVLAAAGDDRSVRLWTVGVQELLALACQRAVRNLTQSEWETYFRDQAYRQTCPALPVHPSVITAMKVQAQTQVRQGKVDDALAALRQAKELDPNLTMTPEIEAASLLVEHGRELASQGTIDEALAVLRQAKELDSSLAFVPEAEVASLLVEHGRELASQGNVTETLAVLAKAKELDPALEERQPLAIARLYQEVCGLASDQDNVTTEVMGICQRAVTLAVATDDAYLNFILCQRRAIASLAAIVEPTCKRASALARPLGFGVTVTGTVAEGSEGLWTFANTTVQAVTIAMNQAQSDLDAYLTLIGPKGDTLTADDDSGGEHNARISDFILAEAGVYTVVAGGYGGSAGAYILSLHYEEHSMQELAGLLVTQGQAQANQGQVEEALATLRKAKELDPSLTWTPEIEVASLLVEHGRELASQGTIDEALAALRQSKQLDPSLAFVPEAEVALVQGRVLARQGKVDDALAALRQAKELDPNLTMTPEIEAASLLVEHGRELASQGTIDEALAVLRQAKELDSSLAFVPEAEVASLLVEHGRELASQGTIDEALAALRQAKQLDPTLESRQPLAMARLYHEVCNQASDQNNLTAAVMDICQRAVTLAVESDDAYLNFSLCGRRSIAQLAEMVEPACNCARALAKPLAFSETVTDTIDVGSGGLWTFANTTVQAVTIAMNQAQGELDAYLTLVGPKGDTLAEDDDSGGERNARIGDFVLAETGVYTIIAHGYGDSAGAYTLSLNREVHSAPELASLLVEHGRELASQSAIDEALATLRQAKELDPSLAFVPEAEVALVQGRVLARQGNVDEALAALRQAKELDPSLAFVPEAEVAGLLVEHGRELARQGNTDDALETLRKAKELDHTLDIEPETEAENLAEAARWLERGRSLAQEGKIIEAIAAYSDTQRLDPTFGISADDWNILCWFGSLYEHAADVLSTCEQAVALAPEHGGIHDSRGLARALTGNIEGAIEDFMFFVAWSKETGGGRNADWREAWIKALQAGQNPFDEATLEALRNE